MILGAAGSGERPEFRSDAHLTKFSSLPAPYRADALSRNLQHEGATDQRIPSAQYVPVPARQRGGRQNQ